MPLSMDEKLLSKANDNSFSRDSFKLVFFLQLSTSRHDFYLCDAVGPHIPKNILNRAHS